MPIIVPISQGIVPHCTIGISTAGIRFTKFRIELYRLIVVQYRARVIAQRIIRKSTIVVRQTVFRANSYRFVVIRYRLPMVT